MLPGLRWLRSPERIEFKLAVLVHRCLHGLAPRYLSDHIQLVADSSRRRLRSSSSMQLVIHLTSGQLQRSLFTGSIARSASRRYLVYSVADFEVFRPTGATRCTDGGDIWHGGGVRVKFHPHRCNG